MTTHSPLPWSVQNDDSCLDGHVLSDANGDDILPIESDGCASDPGMDYLGATIDDLRFIAHVANCHGDLLAACRAALAYDAGILGRAVRGEVNMLAGGGGVASGEDLTALYADWIDKARAAIAKAESGPASVI